MRIATWNVNSLRVRLGHVLDWLESAKPDVLALQETKLRDEDFPVADLEQAGYSVVFSGQPTYNGVAIVSRNEPEDVTMQLQNFDDEQKRVLAATIDGVRVMNLYVPNGQTVDSDKYRYKLDWLGALEAHLTRELESHERIAVLGDFNIAPEDRDVYDPEQWRDKVLCSEPERAALKSILDLGFTDVFRSFEQAEKSFSWWDYRSAAFRRNMGLRIDLILASAPLSRACTQCSIERTPRGWERPSDHVPVIAEFELQ